MDARERWQDDCWKSKWWDSSDWSVYLTRYYTASDRVTVLLQRDDDSYIAWVRVNDAGGDCSIPWPWPWNLTPTTPAEVCAMCERLADQHNLEAKLAKLRVMQPGEVVADDSRSFSR